MIFCFVFCFVLELHPLSELMRANFPIWGCFKNFFFQMECFWNNLPMGAVFNVNACMVQANRQSCWWLDSPLTVAICTCKPQLAIRSGLCPWHLALRPSPEAYVLGTRQSNWRFPLLSHVATSNGDLGQTCAYRPCQWRVQSATTNPCTMHGVTSKSAPFSK